MRFVGSLSQDCPNGLQSMQKRHDLRHLLICEKSAKMLTDGRWYQTLKTSNFLTFWHLKPAQCTPGGSGKFHLAAG